MNAVVSGNTLRLTLEGKTKIATAAGTVGRAYSYALVITGQGWGVLPIIQMTMAYTNNPSKPTNTDHAVVELSQSNTPTDPRAGTTPGGADDYGNNDGRRPDGDWYSRRTTKQLTASLSDCTANNSVSNSGTCAGGITSCYTIPIPMTYSGPWYHPKCSCVGACAPGSAGCPFTTESPCTPYGAGSDIHSMNTYCICTSAADNISGAAETQPLDVESDVNTNADMVKAAIENALSFIKEKYDPLVYTNPSSPIGGAYSMIDSGSVLLKTPIILNPPDYTVPPGSPVLDDPPELTSTATVEGVWVRNPQLHVIVDNASEIGGGGASGPVELADVTLPSIPSVEGYTGTRSLASEYAAYLAEHPEPLPILALADKLLLTGLTVPSGWEPVWTFTSPRFGTFNIDMGSWFWMLIGVFRFLVIGGAYITAFKILAA